MKCPDPKAPRRCGRRCRAPSSASPSPWATQCAPFIRIEGRPLGVIADNPLHLGGAIDSDAADTAARFMQLCDAHDIPLLSLCDNPGNMGARVRENRSGAALLPRLPGRRQYQRADVPGDGAQTWRISTVSDSRRLLHVPQTPLVQAKGSGMSALV